MTNAELARGFVTQLEALIADGDKANLMCFLADHAPALLEVVRAAIWVRNAYRWPPSNELHVMKPGPGNDLAEALRRLEE